MRRAILCAVALVVVGATGPSAGATTSPDGFVPTGVPGTPGAAGPVPTLRAPDPDPTLRVPDAVRYDFDGRAPLADVSGHGHDLSPVARHGGTFATVQHGAGRALAFPAPCHVEPCPRIALRAPTSEDLNPGTDDLRFGAAVRLAPNQTTKGENVLQKGYSARGSQYKLQIDGALGHPSCVLVDDQRPEINVAMSTTGVADGRWHTLECRRSGPKLTIRVDGKRMGQTSVPPDLSIENDIPLSVGGKGSFTDNDQFQGTLDEVWVRIY